MSLVAHVKLSKFRDEVLDCLEDLDREIEYRRRVALKLREYLRKFPKNRTHLQTHRDWPSWMEDASKYVDVEIHEALGLKKSIIDSMVLGQGKTIRAIAAHYRLHMHVLEEDMAFAYDLDKFVFGEDGIPFSNPIFYLETSALQEDGSQGSDTSDFVSIDNLGWNQMPQDAVEYELAGNIRYQIVNRVHSGRDFQYGLQIAHMRIIPDNFSITRQYCSSSDGFPVSYVRDGEYKWYSIAPVDNKQMLRGPAVSGPICLARPDADGDASLRLDVFARPSDFELAITDLASKARISETQPEKANLIEKLFAIYIRKLNDMDEEHVLLHTKSVSV